MGCAGRLSLSLESPSATIQQKALQTYRLPSQSSSSFTTLIIELVKLVQTALYMHGLYGINAGEDIDGLLCNETLAAIRKWRQLFSKDRRDAYLDVSRCNARCAAHLTPFTRAGKLHGCHRQQYCR